MGVCSKCGGVRREGQRYCKSCHAGWMREHRPKLSEMSSVERKKVVARAIANVYQSRGKIQRKRCEVCGAKAEKVLEDWSRPLDVKWLCREHRI